LIWLLGAVAAGCGGRLAGDDAPVASASFDAGIEDAPLPVGDAPGVVLEASTPDSAPDPNDASSSVSPPESEDAGGSASLDSAAPVLDAAAPPGRDAAPPPPPPPACAQTATVSLPAWKPPTPFHQGACTADEISTYTDCLGTAGCTSANAPCDACLQTEASAGAYGPIILGTEATDGFGDAFINWGGCQANLDGHTQAGSCGSETNAWQACASEVCPYSTCGTALDACDDYAYETACSGKTESDACASEWGDGDASVAQCAYFQTLATLWCGP
jgi:hypothetical protein